MIVCYSLTYQAMEETTINRLKIGWRIIVAVGMVAIAFFAVLLCYFYYKDNHRTWCVDSAYSDRYRFEYTASTVRIQDIATGQYLTPKLSLICDDYSIDTLTVFCQNHKCGFLNIYTGKIVIPAQFEYACLFSEGLGAAVQNGKVGFVNSSGETVIPFVYRFDSQKIDMNDIRFESGCCVIMDSITDKYGLIDKSGKWVVEPAYDRIDHIENGYRLIISGDKYGLLDSLQKVVISPENDWVEVCEGGFVLLNGHEKKMVAFDGKTVLYPFLYDQVYRLTYPTDRINEAGEIINALSDMNIYEVAGRYGLMNQRGVLVTKPLYTDIDAIAKDLFVCNLDQSGAKITLNCQGEVVE